MNNLQKLSKMDPTSIIKTNSNRARSECLVPFYENLPQFLYEISYMLKTNPFSDFITSSQALRESYYLGLLNVSAVLVAARDWYNFHEGKVTENILLCSIFLRSISKFSFSVQKGKIKRSRIKVYCKKNIGYKDFLHVF